MTRVCAHSHRFKSSKADSEREMPNVSCGLHTPKREKARVGLHTSQPSFPHSEHLCVNTHSFKQPEVASGSFSGSPFRLWSWQGEGCPLGGQGVTRPHLCTSSHHRRPRGSLAAAHSRRGHLPPSLTSIPRILLVGEEPGLESPQTATSTLRCTPLPTH